MPCYIRYCSRGHISSAASRISAPVFCSECGKPVFDTCPSCGEWVWFDPSISPVTGGTPYHRIAPYCARCGKPYPWKQAALRDARRRARLSKHSPQPTQKRSPASALGSFLRALLGL